jgi:exopolysaccharide biosynthesis polyprenyl glycosylphosphotransferase
MGLIPMGKDRDAGRGEVVLKRHARKVATSLFIADLTVTILSFLVAYGLFELAGKNRLFGSLLPLDEYTWLLLFIVPVWTLILNLSGVYRSHRVDSVLREVWQLVRSVGLGSVALFAFVALCKASHVSRPFLATFAVTNILLLLLLHGTIRGLAHGARARGLNTRSVLIVGTGAGALAHAERIQANPQWGHRLLGFIAEDENRSGDAKDQIIGALHDIRRVLCEYVVDEVVVALPPARLPAMERIILECEEIGIKTRLALDFFPHRIARMEMDFMDGAPMLTFSTTPAEDESMMAKRLIDILFSSLFLLGFSWLYAIIAILIKVTSKGPVFFRQERVGMNGRPFMFFKFRSMVVDADRRKTELAHLNEMDGPVFKIRNDPRVTRVGRFLRKFSLDEFPQMWNVLRGDMSLVGPRPPVPAEVAKYEAWARRRLSIRPGLTCLWQVSGRNSINFKQWMELDLAYIDNWSLSLDFKILLKTVPAVLAGRGAS